MWLVLCEAGDLAALRARRGLLARGLAPVEVVTAGVLACALAWEHRVGTWGASVRITLAGGRVLDGASVRGTLNRLVAAPTAHLVRATPADREYARQEVGALFLSWLESLPGPVVNRPSPQGLCGPLLHRSEWAALAAHAGLPAVPYVEAGGEPVPEPWATTAIVAGEAFAGPPEVAEGCRRLAALAGCALLGVGLSLTAEGWALAGATPLPDLAAGGEAVLDALAVLLGGA